MAARQIVIHHRTGGAHRIRILGENAGHHLHPVRADHAVGIETAKNIAGGMIVVVGYAMVINMMRAGYLMPFFYLGFVTAAFTNFNLVALGVIGTVMAVLYIQLSPKYNRVAGAPAQAAGNNDLDNELD